MDAILCVIDQLVSFPFDKVDTLMAFYTVTIVAIKVKGTFYLKI
jgi:hypothetical protein